LIEPPRRQDAKERGAEEKELIQFSLLRTLSSFVTFVCFCSKGFSFRWTTMSRREEQD
jgi:hypothetical protein